MTMGTLTIGEQTFPITRVRLADGRINFWVDHDGPMDLPGSGEVRVHAPDGSLITAAAWRLSDSDRRDLLEVGEDGIAHVAFPLTVTEIVGYPPE